MLNHSSGLYLGIAASVGLAAIFQFWAADFYYLRDLLWTQPWRIMTAHWVHVGWMHYLLNMLALICLVLIFPKINTTRFYIALLLLPIFISVAIYVFSPDVAAYAGFSGVLHGLYVFAAVQGLGDKKERFFAYCILLGLSVKLVWEGYFGALSGTAQMIGSPVLIEAHQYGVLGGILLSLVFFIIKQID